MEVTGGFAGGRHGRLRGGDIIAWLGAAAPAQLVAHSQDRRPTIGMLALNGSGACQFGLLDRTD